MDSLSIYIQGMNENIEARKMFGKGDNLNNSIGMYTLDLIAKGQITPVQEIILTKALQSRFASSPIGAWVDAFRGISYLTTMGSPISAITQIQDLGFSLYENGLMRTGNAYIKAAFGKSKITRNELGISSIIQEFKEQSKIQGAVTRVFKMVGLEWMDKLGKETMINAYYRKLQSEIRKGDTSGLKDFDFSDDEMVQIIEDMKNDVVSDDIRYILFTKLCEFQPITRSQMPEAYNRMGNGKVFYMLKTYQIKQMDVFRQKAFKDIAEGSKTGNYKQIGRGFKNLFLLTLALGMMGATADILKNLLLNRPFDMTDLMVDNVLKLMGFSKFTIYKVREEDLSSGILSIIAPPLNVPNDILKDIIGVATGKIPDPTQIQSINNIPVGGKLFYWWFGKGDTKSDKKRTG